MFHKASTAPRPRGFIHGGFIHGATPAGFPNLMRNYLGIGPTSRTRRTTTTPSCRRPASPPTSSWSPGSRGVNHPVHVRAQREHGMVEAGSPGCRAGPSQPAAYGDEVVTPHASFLAMLHEPGATSRSTRR